MNEWFRRVLVQATVISALTVCALIFPFFQPYSGIFFLIISLFLILYGFSDPKYMFRRLIASLIALLLIPSALTGTLESIKASIEAEVSVRLVSLVALDVINFLTSSENYGYIITAVCILALLELKNITADIIKSLPLFDNAIISPLRSRLSLGNNGINYRSTFNIYNASQFETLYVNGAEIRISFFKIISDELHEEKNGQLLKHASHSNPLVIPPKTLMTVSVIGSVRSRVYLVSLLSWAKHKLDIGYASAIRFNGSGYLFNHSTAFSTKQILRL